MSAATPDVAVSPEDILDQEATAIVRAAEQTARHTGRPCRLQQKASVLAYLTARLQGLSHVRASAASGLSCAGIKRWIQWGRDGQAPYARFVQALARVDLEPVRATHTGLQPLPVEPMSVQTSTKGSPAVLVEPLSLARSHSDKPHPTAHQLKVWAVRAGMLQSHVKEDWWPSCLPGMFDRLRQEMAAYDVALPVLDLVPPDLPREERTRRYVAWCARHRRPILTDVTIDADADAWYRKARADGFSPGE